VFYRVKNRKTYHGNIISRGGKSARLSRWA